MVSRQCFHLGLSAIWNIKWSEAACSVGINMTANANKKGNMMREKNAGLTLKLPGI